MILVDSSVWVDFVNGVPSAQADQLAAESHGRRVVVGDLILTEVLQGFRSERQANTAQRLMLAFDVVEIAGRQIAVESARNYRALRAKGITIRSTIDVLIATRCIVEGWHLLHRDRDYEPFVTHLGLQPALRLS